VLSGKHSSGRGDEASGGEAYLYVISCGLERAKIGVAGYAWSIDPLPSSTLSCVAPQLAVKTLEFFAFSGSAEALCAKTAKTIAKSAISVTRRRSMVPSP
jgi:hypothetical protein